MVQFIVLSVITDICRCFSTYVKSVLWLRQGRKDGLCWGLVNKTRQFSDKCDDYLIQKRLM
jgi:hypothetical protein